MVLHVTADIPTNRRIEISLPDDAPTGLAHLEIRLMQPGEVVELPMPVIDTNSIPRYFDEQSKEWRVMGRSGVVREVRSA